MSFSDFLEAEVLDHVFGRGAYTPPTIRIALSTANPGETGAGLAEPVGNGYARVAFSTWNRTTNVISNGADVVFPEATGNWGTITHFAIMDAATVGNVLAYAAITPSQAVISGNTVLFKAGQLTTTLD